MIRIEDNQSKKIADSFDDYFGSRSENYINLTVIILVNEFGDKKPQNVVSFNTKSMASDVPVEILK